MSRILHSMLFLTLALVGLAGERPSRAANCASPVAYQLLRPLDVPLHVVTVNLQNREVCVSLAVSRGGIGTSEGFGSLVGRVRPVAALTGTFFSMRNLRPTGDLVVSGRLVNKGHVGSALAITRENSPLFMPLSPFRRADFYGYPFAIRGGPRLLQSGKVVVWLRRDGFHARSLAGRQQRTAVALSRSGKLLLVASARPVTLKELAKSLRRLGATEAIALDGGTSSALYYRGRTLVRPRRRLTNVIVVYDSHRRFQQALGCLAPGLSGHT